MRNTNRFLLLPIKAGVLHHHDDGTFNTLIFGFAHGTQVDLPVGYTHFGAVFSGALTLYFQNRKRDLETGDYFSVVGPARICGTGFGISCSAYNYEGVNVVGGPIEETGRLCYIDGCSDSLLVPPVRKGDPCLNHLHFPQGTRQTPHTHPSLRTGLVYRGAGQCVIPESAPVSLIPGSIFVIPTDVQHSFHTQDETLDVIAFHPDSDVGMTDDDHPMINRTMINGVSAKYLGEIKIGGSAAGSATKRREHQR